MPADVLIYFCRFDGPLPLNKFDDYCSLLLPADRDRIFRFRRWEDAHASLLGKLLLIEALKSFNLKLEDVNYTRFGRPFVDAGVDFNISHSGEYVLCAVGMDVNLGVDVEAIKQVDISDFESVFSLAELNRIKNSPEPISHFFTTWTRKEALIKASGCGLGVDLPAIDATGDKVRFRGVDWLLQPIKLAEGYCAHLCTDKAVDFDLRQLKF